MSDELAFFLDQVEVLSRRRVGCGDPPAELAALGLLPVAGAEPVWAQMSAGEWFWLMRGMARRDPLPAAALASLRLAIEHGEGEGTGFALHAFREGVRWRIRLPVLRAQCESWIFYDGQRIRRVSAALLRQVEGDCFECDDSQTAPARTCTPSLMSSLWRDRLALASGCLWKLWTVTVEHAESRPMFRRHLGDFPMVRLRLLMLFAELLRADEVSERAAAASPMAGAELMGTLRRCSEAIRVETQQICGGTGYMRESAYARTLTWLDWCDGLMRLGPIADGMLDDRLADEIDRRVAARLEHAGIPADRGAALLRPAVHRPLAERAA
jgi:alkylation response protein AidB-like acyl-CoA dehydrogenase